MKGGKAGKRIFLAVRLALILALLAGILLLSKNPTVRTETVKEAMEKGTSYEEVEKMLTEENFEKHLETNFMPDPDLLIRTGGELRISNYLLWQIAYSELYFCDTYWPDFNEECLHKAIASYQARQRRFGKTEAQVEAEEEK